MEEVLATRFGLHEAMIELIGEEHAAILMEYLAPAPWRDLDALGVPLGKTLVAT